MELINATRMAADCSVAMEPSGQELLVVVVKGTFRLPRDGEPLRLDDVQQPLVMADTFSGEPGRSAPLLEMDFAPRKPRCEVLLNGSAYAPAGRPAERVPVGLRIGRWSKRIAVVGDRQWDAGVAGIRSTPPRPFTRQPIGYDAAFGGIDEADGNPALRFAYAANPVGHGFCKHLRWADGVPLPNCEAIDDPVVRPDANHAAVAFGPLGRGWTPRLRYAGTYDQRWIDEVFPFLPEDFDDRYYQAAPEDQQLDEPPGGQEVVLVNLTADGRRSFVMPHLEAPVHVFPRRGGHEDHVARLDTIGFEPDEERVMLSWRLTRPLRSDLFEVAQVLVGKRSPAWWRARSTGKAFLASKGARVPGDDGVS